MRKTIIGISYFACACDGKRLLTLEHASPRLQSYALEEDHARPLTSLATLFAVSRPSSALAVGVASSPAPTNTKEKAKTAGSLVQRAQRDTGLLAAELDKFAIRRADEERECLQEATALVALQQKGGRVRSGQGLAGDTGGFGGGGGAKASKKSTSKGTSKKKKKDKDKVVVLQGDLLKHGSVLAKELVREGVVRMDGLLSESATDALREFVDSERRQYTADVEAGLTQWTDRFSDVVLYSNRCNVLLPLHGPPVDALHELIGQGTVLGSLLEEVVGPDALFNELACLISEPGSQQQPIHPDTPWTPRPPLYAAFVALQDVEADMGPTIYFPGTHTKEHYTEFYGGDYERAQYEQATGHRTNPVPKEYLRSRPVKLGLLKKGDVVLYNQQTLHAGGANVSPDRIRRQFYFSVRDLSVDDVHFCASIRPSLLGKLTLGEVRTELAALKAGKGSKKFDRLFAKDAPLTANA